MNDDTFANGALFVGGGVAGYALGRLVIARWLDDTPISAGVAAPAAPPALPVPTLPSSTVPAAQARPSPTPRRPRTPKPTGDADVGPVTSPAQVEEVAVSPSSSEVGPVSSPAEVDGPVATPHEAAEIRAERYRPSQAFDRIFDMYRESIPIEYLRALAKRESGMNPEEQKGPAWGLMQIVEVVRKDYNERHRTKYTRQDLLDPAINVAIACWLLRFIITRFQKHHPDVPNLRADWDNPRFVELLTFSWNAGFSAAGGVIRVVSYLKKRGESEVTIDRVYQHARAAGAVRHLSNPKKLKWCKSVARLYEQARTVR